MNKKNEKFISGLVVIIIGILLCIFRAEVLKIGLTILGVIVIALGVMEILKNNDKLIEGIIKVIVGIVLIICGWTIIEIALLIFGVILVVFGVYKIGYAIKLSKYAEGFMKKANVFLVPVCTVLLGVSLIISKWLATDVFFIVLGAITIIDGVLILLGKENELKKK